MKLLKGLEEVREVGEDFEVDELAREDHFIVTVVMNKGFSQEIFH
jgi:hypothetical protein